METVMRVQKNGPWKLVIALMVTGAVICSSPGTMNFLEQIKQNYSREIRPNHGGSPVRVRCLLYVSALGTVNMATMDYSVTFYLRKTWLDPRLQFDPSIGEVIFQSQASRIIWVPVISFPDEKNGKIHDLTDENEIIQLWPNGTVVRTMRLTMTLVCYMKAGKFPMDSQKCSLMFESLAYPLSDMLLEWEERGVMMRQDMTVSQFTVDPSPLLRSCEGPSFYVDSFSCLEVVFGLHRSATHYLLQVYLTSALVVCLSWISFWINPRSEPARVTLGMTCVLTLSTEISGVQNSVPDTNTASAIDVWLAMCLLFVFAVLVEFATVSYGYTRLRKRRVKNCPNNSKGKSVQELQNMDQMDSDNEDDVVIEMDFQAPHTDDSNAEVDYLTRAKRFFTISEPGDLDHVCRVIFPIIFVAFCVFYWFAYLV